MEINKISFIIVTYHSHDLIKECVDSVYAHSDINEKMFELLIVDNSDSDGHQELLQALQNIQKPNLRILKNEKNLGYGAGNNTGIKAASGNIIAVMNPDVRLTEPLLKDALQKFEADEQLALLGYRQTGGKNLSFYRKPEWKFFLSDWYVRIKNKLHFFNYKKDFLSGAFFFADKEKFAEIGMFDENIFMYFEEADISNRIIAKQYKIKFDKTKSYLHLIGNRIQFSQHSFTREISSLAYYLEKYGINKKHYLKKLQQEYRLKLFAASLINDEPRKEKFRKELETIRRTFGKK
ncbi:MAG: glycosyltransferase family 2 protein [Bergeyella sp.]